MGDIEKAIVIGCDTCMVCRARCPLVRIGLPEEKAMNLLANDAPAMNEPSSSSCVAPVHRTRTFLGNHLSDHPGDHSGDYLPDYLQENRRPEGRKQTSCLVFSFCQMHRIGRG